MPQEPGPRPRPFRLVQLSDSHLAARPGARLRGVVTLDTLLAVLGAIRARAPDRLLLTGDLSHDGSEESYRLLRDALGDLTARSRLIPGNHDAPDIMARVLGGATEWPQTDRLGRWRLIRLSTHVPGAEGGRLGRATLEALDEQLAGEPGHPTLVALHHPPLATGSPWLDAIGLADAEALRRCLARHRQIRAVLFGHAHQEIDRLADGVRWLGCPATCVQFLPQSETALSDTRLPGYRWLDLHDDGTLETGVERLSAWPAGSAPEEPPA